MSVQPFRMVIEDTFLVTSRGTVVVGNESFPVPANLNTPEFLEAWSEWDEFRREVRKKLTKSSVKKQLKELSAMGLPAAIESINQSIKNGWTGLFERKKEANGSKAKHRNDYMYR